MVAPVKQVRSQKPARGWQKMFLAMLPSIVTHARIVFGRLHGDNRDDMIQEVIANSFVAFARLAELNKLDLAYPGVLARYAVAQVLDGRRVGNRLNIRDVASPHAQKRKGLRLERLDRYDEVEDCWQEILIEDKTVAPADLAASRIDFPHWLSTLSPRNRKIAMKLAAGESTGEVARRFGMSAGRVSQLRRELRDSWQEFHGEDTARAVVPA